MSNPSPILCTVLSALVFAGVVNADPYPVNFVTPPSEFVAGSLEKNNGWKVAVQSPANGDFVIQPGVGLLLMPNTGGTHALAYAFLADSLIAGGRDRISEGMPATFTANFFLKQSGATGKGALIGLGWALFLPAGMNNVPFIATFSRSPEMGGYRLGLSKHSDQTQITGGTEAGIPEAELGFKDGKSDPLQLSMTLVNMGRPSEWASVCMLTNLRTQKTFTLQNTMSAPGVYKADDLIRTIINFRRADQDGLDAVVVTELDAEPVPAPTLP
jgi:hypothetical protein